MVPGLSKTIHGASTACDTVTHAHATDEWLCVWMMAHNHKTQLPKLRITHVNNT